MKSNLIAKTLGLVALTGIAVLSPLAQANDWQDNDNRRYGYSEAENYREGFSRSQVRESLRYSRIVNDRQDRQLDKIIAGVDNNRLSKNEFLRLMQEQKALRAMERNFMDDGRISEGEFRRLSRGLDSADRNIKVAKQNGHPQHYSALRPAWANN